MTKSKYLYATMFEAQLTLLDNFIFTILGNGLSYDECLCFVMLSCVFGVARGVLMFLCYAA